MIGQRLKIARAAAGLSLRGLEAAIGNRVTAQAIGKYERGESMPGSGVLIALADALGVSVDYLVGDREMVLEDVDFRKKTVASKREVAQVEAQVLRMLEGYLMVEELLRLPSVEWDKPRDAPFPVVNDVAEADRGARALRSHWGLGIDPIPDLVEILEGRGVKVLSVTLAENIDGLTARVRRAHGGAVPVIVVNGAHWGERQRFTIAHELGHMVLATIGRKVDGEKGGASFRRRVSHAGRGAVVGGRQAPQVGRMGRALQAQAVVRGKCAGPRLPLQGSRHIQPDPLPAVVRGVQAPRLA